MDEPMKYVLHRKYPFYKKIPKTDLEILFDTEQEAMNLMFAAIPIIIVASIIGFFVSVYEKIKKL